MVLGNRAASPTPGSASVERMSKVDRVAAERQAMEASLREAGSSSPTIVARPPRSLAAPLDPPIKPRGFQDRVPPGASSSPRRASSERRRKSPVLPRKPSPSKQERIEQERSLMSEHAQQLRESGTAGGPAEAPTTRPTVRDEEVAESYGTSWWGHHSAWVKAVSRQSRKVITNHSGPMVASGGWDNDITVWSGDKGVSQVLKGHDHWVQAVVWLEAGAPGSSPDLASCSFDGTVKLWDSTNGKCLHTLAGHAGPVMDMAVLEKGLLATASWDRSIRVWQLEDLECQVAIGGCDSGRVRSVCLLPKGENATSTKLAAGEDTGTIRIWDWSSGECDTLLSGHQAAVWAVCPVEEANQDQVVLVSGSCDNTVKLWDTTQCAGTLHGHTGYVTAICVHQHTICSASFDKTVRVWDLQQRCLLVLRDHSDSVMCLCCWEEDGGLMLMSGSCDNTVRQYGPLAQN
eukprot:TRINITY_DN20912_c0_g1_i4.p1 TRINITY_DN20912_c0_g1~~TRINITY_DN20912_c0_g1_i4.p1  ORF type:complete len:460 (-),score=84.57 TRINITY_DN20912_c0_g1_i4:67-1446(-)